MANPLAVALAPTGAQTTGGTGSSVDLGALRKALRLELAITAISGGATAELTVELETSADGASGWRPTGAFTPLGTISALEQHFGPVSRFVRAKWTLTDITSVTFTLAGEAHVIYAEPKHVRKFGIKGPALDKVSDAELVEYCIVASTEADGYMAGGMTLPLTAWDDDLRLHVSKITAFHYLNGKGRIPTGPDDLIDMGNAAAVKWLRGVGAGTINPPGLVDSTPEVNESSFAVVSAPRRW